jgi:peroxiredoxin Q/BCP
MTEDAPVVGDLLPAIVAETAGGPLDLSKFRGKNHIVLWTYPKDDTPGCTVEAQEFTARAAEFAAAGAVLIGISKDGVASHKRFAEKYGLECYLLSDPDGAALDLLGVEKAWHGRGKRTTFVIDRTGVIRHVYENVSPRGHADAVLAAVKAL